MLGVAIGGCGLHTAPYDMSFFYLYYAIGLPTFLSIIIALYLLFTGTSHLSLFLCKKKPLLSCRLGGSVQCRPVPGRVKSIQVGVDGHRSLHRIQRSRSRMVRALALVLIPPYVLIGSSVWFTQGDLRHWLVHPRRWCSRTPYTDQESHQVCSSTECPSGGKCPLANYPYLASSSVKS